MPSLPEDKFAPMGATTGGLPVVCGGKDSVIGESSNCYIYNDTSTSWDFLAELAHARESAASVQIDADSFWILGGYHNTHQKTTEIFDPALGAFVDGPLLPYGVDQHCVAQVNETHFFLSGGEIDLTDEFTTQVVMWNGDSAHWDLIPDMNLARGHHACGVAHTDSGPELVVAGGSNNEDAVFYTSQIYNLNSNTWRTGPILPNQIHGPASVQYGDTFLITGGLDEHDNCLHTIYEYDWSNEAWLERSEVIGGLILGRCFHSASLVDNGLGLCS